MTYQQEIAAIERQSANIRRAATELREELASLPPVEEPDETEMLRAQVIRQALLLRRILDSATESGGSVAPIFDVELSAADMLQIQAEVFAAPLPPRTTAAPEIEYETNEECPF